MANILIYDRISKKTFIEKQKAQKGLSFLYDTFFGRIVLNLFVKRKWVSVLYGKYQNSKISSKKIKKYIAFYGLNMEEYNKENYKSFNDFFIRKIKVGKRPIASNKNDLIAPADSKLSIYQISDTSEISIKGNNYTIASLLQDKELEDEYSNGICLVFRLSVEDYHRYIFFDDGSVDRQKKIQGFYHTVGHISSKRYKIYKENTRICNVLNTNNFGKVIQIEVGATMVGRIVNHSIKEFKKGEEKGYFCFGGSTIVLLFKKGVIKMDDDIINVNKKDVEIRIKQGEKIGIKIA